MGRWCDILSDIDTFSGNPVLVVSSHRADAYLWAEILNLGGFDVIAKPFDTCELRQVVEAASRCAPARPEY